tara:strand:- start:658 stop:1047 length:390 start_codon:yes stop_codon:yes gene_type:complete
MFRNLFVFIVLFLGGCLFSFGPSESHTRHSPEQATAWLYDPYVSCYYDTVWGTSDWYVEIYADSYYDRYDVASVRYVINNSYDYIEMGYLGYSAWGSSFYGYHDCDRLFRFDFIAIDHDGVERYYTHYW